MSDPNEVREPSMTEFLQHTKLPDFTIPGYTEREDVIVVLGQIVRFAQRISSYKASANEGDKSATLIFGSAQGALSLITLFEFLDVLAPLEGEVSWNDTIASLAAMATEQGVGFVDGPVV